MAILKKLLLVVAVLISVAFAAVVVAGFLIPAERSLANEIEIDAPAEKVWQVITDKPRYTEWQTQLDRVEIIDYANWIEYPKNAPEPLKFHLVNDARPTTMEFGYTMSNSIHGHWKGDVTPTATGVRLKTIDSYRIDSWPMKMLMGAFFDLDGFAKDWNNKLKRRVETLR